MRGFFLMGGTDFFLEFPTNEVKSIYGFQEKDNLKFWIETKRGLSDLKFYRNKIALSTRVKERFVIFC
jgi:hypothetical protein